MLDVNFSELRQREVRKTPKFSRSPEAASRYSLLRFLASFVATSAGVSPIGNKTRHEVVPQRLRGHEIATANFGEFTFHALR
jgi:hypothetical protein